MSIDSISAISNSILPSPSDATNSSQLGNTSGNNFMNLVIDSLDENIKSADEAVKSYILQDGISTHELMITLEETKHSLQMAVEIRNKLVSAYEEVIRMRL